MKLQLKFVTMVEPMGCGKVQRPTPQHNNREGCSSRVGLKTGRENPVPTVTESRINRSYTVLIKK